MLFGVWRGVCGCWDCRGLTVSARDPAPVGNSYSISRGRLPCVYVCIYIYIYIYVCVCIYVCICVCVCLSAPPCLCAPPCPAPAPPCPCAPP